MEWITYTLLASFLLSSSNIIDKIALSRWQLSLHLPLLAFCTIGGIAAGLIPLYVPLQFKPTGFILSLISGILYCLVILLLYAAIRIEEISRVIPVLFLAPFVTAVLAALFLNEELSVTQYIGGGLLVVGAFGLSTKSLRELKPTKAFGIMLVAACVMGIHSVIIKAALRSIDYWSAFTYARIAGVVFLLIFSLFQWKRIKYAFEHNKVALLPLGIIHMMVIIALWLLTLAREVGTTTQVDALSSVQPVLVLGLALFVSFIAPHLLTEDRSRGVLLQKLGFVVVIVIGAILVVG